MKTLRTEISLTLFAAALALAAFGGITLAAIASAPTETQPVAPAHAKFLPNPKLTPGLACAAVTLDDLRSPQFIRDARTHGTKDGVKITDAVKQKVYAAYGVTTHRPGEYEIDHLISLELGGSNDPRNLWPQPYAGLWNAHQKDRLENEVHRRVLAGAIDLKTAQQLIAQDWIALYVEFFPADVINGAPKPVSQQPNAEPDK